VLGVGRPEQLEDLDDIEADGGDRQRSKAELSYGKKPVETRRLRRPGSHAFAGCLKLWVDIFRKADAALHHPVHDIALPPPEPCKAAALQSACTCGIPTCCAYYSA
jgi:hypothetical protein